MTTDVKKQQGEKPVILQVLPALHTGGVERGSVDVAAATEAAEFKSVVTSAGGPMVHQVERVGAKHVTLPLDSKNPFTIFKNIKRLEKVIKRENVSVVHARSRAPAWSAYFACRRLGVPFMTTFHGTYNFDGPIKKFYNSVMQKGEKVIAISEFIVDHMMENYKTPWSKIRLVRRGMDLDVFNPEKVPASRVVKLATEWRLPDGVPVVMLSGRLTRWKGQILLLKALGKLDMNVRCLLVGSGRPEYQSEVEALAKELSIDDRVHVVGECRDMAAAYKLADVVVSASTDPEAFGRVAVEGQAMGRPVVAPHHGGAVEQIEHGVTGWLFKPGDPDDLARMLKKALSLDEAQRKEFHDRAIKSVHENFTNEKMLRRTLNVYREILDLPLEKKSETTSAEPKPKKASAKKVTAKKSATKKAASKKAVAKKTATKKTKAKSAKAKTKAAKVKSSKAKAAQPKAK
ncbi:glycosyltransferase family 4 protein [Curvivirga sp.]|uniref:glycosyltransferase family 4 protein n=1 Tax=Curvivirga sp. TaxID=2856848 RepID=UPI003B5C3422